MSITRRGFTGLAGAGIVAPNVTKALAASAAGREPHHQKVKTMGLTNVVERPKFEDYKKKYEQYFIMERRDGVILLRMHTQGGPVQYSLAVHNAWGQAWHDVGNDPENEVMILTSTGSTWIGKSDQSSIEEDENKPGGSMGYDTYYDATKLIENFLNDFDIPTIAAVNGPGFHTEFALMCDITLCANHTQFEDPHYLMGFVPGDGLGLAFQELLGPKRAAYHLYTGQGIDANTALDLGLVNEVLPTNELVERAWEIAGMIMKAPRVTRRLTSQLMRRSWKRRVLDDLQMHLAYEGYAAGLEHPSHDFEKISKTWKK